MCCAAEARPILIDETTAVAFEALLHFVYSDALEVDDEFLVDVLRCRLCRVCCMCRAACARLCLLCCSVCTVRLHMRATPPLCRMHTQDSLKSAGWRIGAKSGVSIASASRG